LEIAADLPLLRRVVYWETKGLWFYEDERLLFLNNLISMGREFENKTKISFQENGERTQQRKRHNARLA